MANLMLSVMGAFAELERSLIRERQREGLALTKQRGAYSGAYKGGKRPSHRNEPPNWSSAPAAVFLVFGQQAESIARLTWDDVTITKNWSPSNSGQSSPPCRIHWTSLGMNSPQTQGTT
jgi:DNA invertase Pin-like site-specific DNA recombinase